MVVSHEDEAGWGDKSMVVVAIEEDWEKAITVEVKGQQMSE